MLWKYRRYGRFRILRAGKGIGFIHMFFYVPRITGVKCKLVALLSLNFVKCPNKEIFDV